MIIDFARRCAVDEVEQALPDVASVRALAVDDGTGIGDVVDAWRARWRARDASQPMLVQKVCDAVILAHARLARRHGRRGDDFHAYHNEGHVADICGARIARVEQVPAPPALGLRQSAALMLFGAGHDLRQREAPLEVDGIGANEQASIAEMTRILDCCGFSREEDRDLYIAVELTIAGSTFDARPGAGTPPFNAADVVQTGGALAAHLDAVLDRQRPGWRGDPDVVGARELAKVAADIDTANVAESFDRFGASAEALCREREMLSARPLDDSVSGPPVLQFLTDGQERFFFGLHRFHSDAGRHAFSERKADNAPKLTELCRRVRERAADLLPATGQAVIEVYREALARVVG